MTPAIPASLYDLVAPPGLVNPLALLRGQPQLWPDPAHPSLWGTETFLGDWSGRLLIVLKDFAPTNYIECNGYRHSQSLVTNVHLHELLSLVDLPSNLQGSNAKTCGMLYTSACFFVVEGKKFSKTIPVPAIARSWPALEFTISKMPNLTDIVLAGAEAFGTFRRSGGLPADRALMMQRRVPVVWRGCRVHATCHPSQRGLNSRGGFEAALDDWRAIAAHI